MPAVAPRIQVVVTQEQYMILARLAQLRGGSMSSYARRAIDASMPSLRRVLSACEQAELEGRLLDENLQAATEDLLDRSEDLLADQMDLEEWLVPQEDRGSGRRRRGAKPHDTPRHEGPILTGPSQRADDDQSSTIIPLRGRR